MIEKIKRIVAAWHLRRARAIVRERRAGLARARSYRAELDRAQRFAGRVVGGLLQDLERR